MNLNEQGQQYDFVAIGGDVPDYGVLSTAARQQYGSLQQFLDTESVGADHSRKAWLLEIGGCLSKLSSALFQISRLRFYHDELVQSALTNFRGKGPGALATVNLPALTDFESLLFHGRAALDRTTLFISREFKQYNCSRYSRLRNVLGDFKDKDQRAQELITILDESPTMPGIFVDEGDAQSLRSFVTHRGSITESLDHYFSISNLTGGKALILDSESKGIPVLHTSRECVIFLPFIILNSLAVLTGFSKLSLDQYQPEWDNLSTVLSSYISDANDGVPLSVIVGTLDGFVVKTAYVHETIFTKCVQT